MSAAAETTTGAGVQAPGLASIVRAAQDRLAHAVHVGQLRDDPLCAALEAISVSLDAQLRLHDASIGQVREAREPLDPAAVEQLQTAAVTGAERRAANLARAHNWRTIMIAAAVLVGGVVAGVAGGYWFGRNARTATAAEIATTAFRDGPGVAADWLRIMRSNDIEAVLASCTGKAVLIVGGRRACGAGLWLDEVNPGAPAVVVTTNR